MALSNIDKVRVMIGDVEGTPFHPILQDDHIDFALELSNGNLLQASKRAGIWAAQQIASFPIKEYVGDTEIWTNYPAEYRQALELLLDDSKVIPSGLWPYAAGISYSDVCAQIENEDNIISPLEQLATCRLRKSCGDC